MFYEITTTNQKNAQKEAQKYNNFLIKQTTANTKNINLNIQKTTTKNL